MKTSRRRVSFGDVVLKDFFSPWVRHMARTQPQWTRKALKSSGWWLQQQVKKGIRSGAPGGSLYKPLSGVVRRGRNGAKRLGRTGGGKTPLKRLADAVGYEYSSGRVRVGWLSRSAVHLGSMQEKGASVRVTAKMRRLYWASAGRTSRGKIRKGSILPPGDGSIDIPKRPTFRPLYDALYPRIGDYMESKLREYIRDGGPVAGAVPGRRRKYRVEE